MCELLVGLPAVNVLGVEDLLDGPLFLHIETRTERPGCRSCGVLSHVKDRPVVVLVDLPAFGRPTRTCWHKTRWCCPDPDCPAGSWTEECPTIAAPRMIVTDRAGRWATEQVGRCARSVAEVAKELGCDWHTVNDAVVAYGTALLDDDPSRIGDVEALGLDEVLFCRRGRFHTKDFATSVVDVAEGQLLDVVPGRSGRGPAEWLERRGEAFCSGVRVGTLDLSSSYRAVFEAVTPAATLVADPFHVVRLANTKVDECRRRVQNESLGHRGRKPDPLYRCRRLLVKADERLDEGGRAKLLGLLRAGDPKGQLTTTWHAKEAVRELYTHADFDLAGEWIDRLIADMADKDNPVEVRSLGRTLKRWRDEIIAWHQTLLTNGPTEAMNNLIKRVKRAAFGLTNFTHFRVRALLYAGKPNWELLRTVVPR